MAELDPKAFGYAGAVVSGVLMFLLGVLAPVGIYSGAADQMMRWHMFFSLDAFGIITGVIEAAALSFIFMYLFALAYNKFA